MYPNGFEAEMARARIAERVRQAEADRRSRPIAQHRMAERRRRAAALLSAVISGSVTAPRRSIRVPDAEVAAPRTA